MYEQEDTSWSFTIGLFVGAIVGAALATLFTPRSGQQNRELVMEKGLVLKDRVADATTSVATSVKGTTSSAVSTVKETTSSAVSTVKDATSSAVSTVKETTNSAVSTVKDATDTAVSKVSDTVSTVKDKASTVAERVSDVASTATDKARELTGRAQSTTEDTTADTPSATEMASEARYDAEDVRPVTTTAPTSTITAQPHVGITPTTTEEQTAYAGTASRVYDTPALSTPAAREAASELASPEQFEATETGTSTSGAGHSLANTRTVAGTDADVREASEGAERNG